MDKAPDKKWGKKRNERNNKCGIKRRKSCCDNDFFGKAFIAKTAIDNTAIDDTALE